MGHIEFFVAWELWQQMTFVLACCIVVVFFAGLVKLWWINRSVRMHEKLDEEKKSRMSEMRSTGLPIARRPDIPFGVRAIQSGIEVDGIWISRPGTPNSESPLTSTPLQLFAHEPKGKGKARAISDGRSSVLAGAELSAAHPSPTSNKFDSSNPMEANRVPPKFPAPGPQNTYRPKYVPTKPAMQSSDSYHVDTLKQLEGSYERPALETYVPTTSISIRSPAPTTAMEGQRPYSNSSDESFTQSAMRANPRRKSPFPDVMRAASYYTKRDSYDDSQRNPFSTPEPSLRERAGSSASPPTTSQNYRMAEPTETRAETLEHFAQPPRPERSYSGEIHANQPSRRVNAGFENVWRSH